MQLPGGLVCDNGHRRDFAIKPIRGYLEFAIAESGGRGDTTPTRITRVLTAALEHIGGRVPSHKLIAGLAVGDRQFLMRQLAVALGMDDVWYTARCTRCEDSFDFPVEQSALPVKKAGREFPYAEVSTSLGRLRFHVPTGFDQERIASLANKDRAAKTLVQACLCETPGAESKETGQQTHIERLTEADMLDIETALEMVAPEVTTIVEVACPACGHLNRLYVDPYYCLDHQGGSIYSEIHVLASTYHWSQRDILDLPRMLRQRYLNLIDEDRGLSH